jgi:hypothetical protein
MADIKNLKELKLHTHIYATMRFTRSFKCFSMIDEMKPVHSVPVGDEAFGFKSH